LWRGVCILQQEEKSDQAFDLRWTGILVGPQEAFQREVSLVPERLEITGEQTGQTYSHLYLEP
jgi:hypothetical protein